MNSKIKKRLYLTLFAVFFFSIGLGLILTNFRDNIVFYYTPSETYNKNIKNIVRIGGDLKEGSIESLEDQSYSFIIKDDNHEIRVEYKGALPRLFKETQTIIAEGKFKSKNYFIAKQILAKHDENYKPKTYINKQK